MRSEPTARTHRSRPVSTRRRRRPRREAGTDAVEFAAHALGLTASPATERGERLLTLAERFLEAGEPERASGLLTPELDSLPTGPLRARAHLVLADSDFLQAHVDESGRHIEQALSESIGDPGSHAVAAARWSHYLTVGGVERIAEAEQSASDVLQAARRAGPHVEGEVLHALASARKLRGLLIDDLSRRFEAASADALQGRGSGRFTTQLVIRRAPR